jgi:hypothetical protein
MGENTNIPWCDHTFNPWVREFPTPSKRDDHDDRSGALLRHGVE